MNIYNGEHTREPKERPSHEAWAFLRAFRERGAARGLSRLTEAGRATYTDGSRYEAAVEVDANGITTITLDEYLTGSDLYRTVVTAKPNADATSPHVTLATGIVYDSGVVCEPMEVVFDSQALHPEDNSQDMGHVASVVRTVQALPRAN